MYNAEGQPCTQMPVFRISLVDGIGKTKIGHCNLLSPIVPAYRLLEKRRINKKSMDIRIASKNHW